MSPTYIFIMILCVLYFSCLPNTVYGIVKTVINKLPVKIAVVLGVSIVANYNTMVAIMLLLCYIITINSCSCLMEEKVRDLQRQSRFNGVV